jgi:lysylphosphatidylglycerol synthetase-like protein (DUF2156 family)
MDVMHLGYSFGLLDSQAGRVVSGIMAAVHLMLTLKASLGVATAGQVAHTVATMAGAGAQTTFMIATSGAVTAQTAQVTTTEVSIIGLIAHKAALFASTVAHGIYAAAVAVCAYIQGVLTIETAAWVALTGVGIALLIVAAAAVWAYAQSLNAATASLQNFNEAAARAPSAGRSLQRAGELILYSKGVEVP